MMGSGLLLSGSFRMLRRAALATASLSSSFRMGNTSSSQCCGEGWLIGNCSCSWLPCMQYYKATAGGTLGPADSPTSPPGARLASLPGGVDEFFGGEGFSSLISFSFLSSQALNLTRSLVSLVGNFLLLSWAGGDGGGGFAGLRPGRVLRERYYQRIRDWTLEEG